MPAIADIVAFFAHPIVAAVVGVALGVALLSMTAAGVRSFTPETLEVGAMRAVAMLLAGLFLALAGLFVYYQFVRAGLVAFGLGLVGGFVVPATIALFRMPGLVKTSK